MKIRKVKRGKHFRYNVNRKRLRKVKTSTGDIQLREIKEHWEDNRSVRANLNEMGLALDVNQTLGVPNTKQKRLNMVKIVNDLVDDADSTEPKTGQPPRKAFVAQQLEEEAKTPRESQFRLPRGHIAELGYFLDKHKLNYSAMVTDHKNFNQWTWRQFRAKIKRFMSIGAQFEEYLNSRSLTRDDMREWVEYDSD